MPKIPGVQHRDAVRALQKAGFRIVREGKHIIISDGTRILTIPRGNLVNAFTLGGIVKDAGPMLLLTDRAVQLAGLGLLISQWPSGSGWCGRHQLGACA